MVSEQMAVSLHLKPGDTLNLKVPGLSQPYPVKISGTVNTDLADPLFSGPKAAPEGAYNFAAAVVVMDYPTFQRDLAGPLQAAFDQANQNPNAILTNPNVISATPRGFPSWTASFR